ncbi:MAG: ParB/RepB/Spo0J family partition protein [Oscillospiraceae bacterium]
MNRPRTARPGICEIPVDEIDPNPTQPRRSFADEGLKELSDSIAEYGILNPITVRLHYGRYEIIAGERRLRAAKQAGLRSVPCIVLNVDMERSSLLAMVENIQREDLDYIEEARGMANLIRLFDISQDEVAKRLGKSQSAVANKLRLLKLPQDVLAALRENALTERHGRALLRLSSAEEQRGALKFICEHTLNVAQTDAYIDRLISEQAQADEPVGKKKAFILKDVRVFLNTIARSLDLMKQGGIAAGMQKTETDSELIVTISIPKNR